MKRHLILLIATPILFLLAGTTGAAPPAGFTAHYEVLRSGQRIGEASMTLARQGDAWEFVTDTRGTAGLAGFLGIDADETSRFQWRGDMPEMLQYDYRLDGGLKHSTRRTRVDWPSRTVQVDDSRKGSSRYAAQPGLVDRHLLALALAQALSGGSEDITLPVAVRDRVETEHFRVAAREPVDVPAGRYGDAVRVERSDRDRGFVAWYAPARYPVPLKLTQGGKLELRLVDFASATTGSD
jgi:hypothetical protein